MGIEILWEVLEGIIGKNLSILGSSLEHVYVYNYVCVHAWMDT